MTGTANKRATPAALTATKPGCRARLIYHHARRPRARQRPAQGLHRTDHAHLLDAAHQQPGSPLVVVWDNRNTHVSRAMADAIAVRETAPFLGAAWFYRRPRPSAAANHA